MPSQIDDTKPVEGAPTTASVRANFTTAKVEISDLQSKTAGAPYLPLAGGQLTGALLLAGDPTSGQMAATKDYVDAHGTGGGGGLPEAPADGTLYGRRNGAWVPSLPLAGGTLTGALILAAAPSVPLGAATKGYVDTAIGGAVTPASETVVGVARIATQAEVDAGADDLTIVTPLKLRVTYQMPPGTIVAYAAAAAPSGWLLCNGAAVSRTTYAALFAAIGVTYGAGNGSTTFNLPEMRGRVPAGFDPGNATGRLTASATGGVSAAALGNAGGEQAHALATAELAAHNHGVTDPGHVHNTPGGTNLFMVTNNTPNVQAGSNATGPTAQSLVTASATTGVATTNTGTGSAHNVAQPTLIVNWLIKA